MDGEALSLPSALVARARAGDPEAMEDVCRTYESAVYTLAYRICGSEADAEDVAQDALLEVCRSIRRYRGDGPLWSWVRRVTVSKALMHLRRERRRRATFVDGAALEFSSAWSSRPAIRDTDLEAALLGLDPSSRAVLWLHEVEGYTHGEIGAMMGKSESFSKSRLSRAYRELREKLA